MSFTSPEHSAPAEQDQQVTPDPTTAATPPVQPAPTPAQPGTAPWAADLNSIFTDESVRGQVDGYLREKVQPRVTQLEQQVAQSKDAMNLWQSFQEDPVQTYAQITQELFPDHAQTALDALQGALQAQQAAVPQEQTQTVDPRLQSVISYVEQQQQTEWYNQELNRIKADPQYQDVNADLLHTYVAATEGDWNQAVEMYRRDAQVWKQQYAPPPPADPNPVDTNPPNVMGSDTGSAATPPVQPQGQTLDEAINDLVRDMRGTPAPPVGSM